MTCEVYLLKQRHQLIMEILEKQKLLPIEEINRQTVKDLPLNAIKCLSCGRFINFTERGNIIFRCPNCGEGIIIRCRKCRRIGRTAKCPVCGAEYP